MMRQKQKRLEDLCERIFRRRTTNTNQLRILLFFARITNKHDPKDLPIAHLPNHPPPCHGSSNNLRRPQLSRQQPLLQRLELCRRFQKRPRTPANITQRNPRHQHLPKRQKHRLPARRLWRWHRRRSLRLGLEHAEHDHGGESEAAVSTDSGSWV